MVTQRGLLVAGLAGLLVGAARTRGSALSRRQARAPTARLRLVVTGCCGRIGKAAVAALSQRGHSVVGVDIVQAPVTLRRLLVEFVQADLSVAGVADRIVAGVDAVIHLAACPDDADFMSALLQPNIVGCVRLLDACKAHSVPRVIIASSGKVMVGHTKSCFPLGTAARVAPRDLYCASKLFAEAATEAHAHNTGAQCICVRFSWCPRTAADIQAMEGINVGAAGVDEYLSPNDAGRFCALAVEANLPGAFRFETLYCSSLTPASGIVRFDPGPASKLIGYYARDTFPTGNDDILDDSDYSANPNLFARRT